MRILVTGSDGFVGRHLVHELLQSGHEAIGVDLSPSRPGDEACDICSPDDTRDVVHRIQPDAGIHLAGMAFVPHAWEQPRRVMDINVMGALNVMEAFRQNVPSARLLVIGSAQIYGMNRGAEPLDENAAPQPENPYALSKLSADLSALMLAERHDLPILTARPINHIGPGQSPDFVTSAFARRLMDLKNRDAGGSLQVGNLESRRDFLDVRDVVKAYRLLIEKAPTGKAYNIATGKDYTIGDILDRLCDIAGVHPPVDVCDRYFRPTDRGPLLNIGRIQAATGWTPEIPLDHTLTDLFTTIANEQSGAPSREENN